MSCLRNFQKLKTHRDFQRVYKQAKKWHTETLISFYMPHDNLKSIGFTASKRVGKAVKRNRAKRRLRALFIKHCDFFKSGTYIFVAKDLASDIEFLSLEKHFLYSLKKLNATI